MDSPFSELSIDVPNFSFFQKMAEQQPNPTNSGEICIGIVGIASGDRCQLCHEHPVCGVQLIDGSMVCLRKKVLLVDGIREVTVAVNLVFDDRVRS